MTKYAWVSLLFFLFLLPSPARAEEVIHNYHTRIEVRTDGSLHVTETIEVTAEGDEIKRGIYRDFPLIRRTFLGGRLPSQYTILSVKRDGENENWHSETSEENSSFRVYIGESNVFLKSGRYRYDIEYETSDQVFSFDTYDELNWNVIGAGWMFPIEKGSAEIILPQGAQVNNYTAYTGRSLSRDQNFTAHERAGSLFVELTAPLAPYQGMTVAVSWSKGFVSLAPDMVGMAFFWKQHAGLQWVLLSFAFLCFYYYTVWRKFGVDPKSRGLAPFYTPPEGISPAMAAMIHTMGDCAGRLCMTAACVSLGSKGYLNITEDGQRQYTLARANNAPNRPPMSEDEQVIYDGIGTRLSIHSGSENLISVSADHAKTLENMCLNHYYVKNTKWWVFGILIFLYAVGILVSQNDSPELLFMGLLFSCIFGGISLGVMIYGVKQLFTAPAGQKFGAIFMIIWAAVFSIGGLVGLWFLANQLSWLVIVVIILMLALVVKMRVLIKAPTVLGRAVMDHLKGLEYYMSAVEEKVLKAFDPPEMSRELYETYLPYAVALNVESKWADKFAVSVAGAMTVAAAAGVASAPSWYHSTSSGSMSGFSPSGMVSSFGGALAAASTSNSTSSSSSGGGSSGGGGGGGGGGGW